MTRCETCGARWNLGDNQWISVKDRLPKKDEQVLVYRNHHATGDEILISFLVWMLNREPIWSDEVSDYTHWMPLPEPPNENTQ